MRISTRDGSIQHDASPTFCIPNYGLVRTARRFFFQSVKIKNSFGCAKSSEHFIPVVFKNASFKPSIYCKPRNFSRSTIQHYPSQHYPAQHYPAQHYPSQHYHHHHNNSRRTLVPGVWPTRTRLTPVYSPSFGEIAHMRSRSNLWKDWVGHHWPSVEAGGKITRVVESWRANKHPRFSASLSGSAYRRTWLNLRFVPGGLSVLLILPSHDFFFGPWKTDGIDQAFGIGVDQLLSAWQLVDKLWMFNYVVR